MKTHCQNLTHFLNIRDFAEMIIFFILDNYLLNFGAIYHITTIGTTCF